MTYIIGSPKYTIYDPMCPPATPSVLNDEFTVDGVGIPTGWTDIGNLTPTCTVTKGRLLYQTTAAANFSAASIYKNLPAGPFTIVTRVTLLSEGSFVMGALAISNSTSGRRLVWSMNRRPGNYGVFQCGWQKMSSFTARDAAVDEIEYYTNGAFIAIVYDGTNVYLQYSVDGFFFTTFYQEAMTSYFTGGNLPDRVHLETQSQTSNVPIVSLDFFRYFPTAFADIGRNINA
jgi:hypothetical protein